MKEEAYRRTASTCSCLKCCSRSPRLMFSEERIIYYISKSIVYMHLWLLLCKILFFLSLAFIIIINTIAFTNKTTTPDMISPIHSSSITAYAQQQQEQQHSNGNQEWVDRQSSTKVSFAYSPETPLVGASTQLIFNI